MTTTIDPISGQKPIASASAPRSAAEQQRLGQALEQLYPVKETAPPSQEELVKAVQRIDEALRPYDVIFELHEASGRMVARLIERESGEEIKSIPGEAVLALAERLPEIQGLLVGVKI